MSKAIEELRNMAADKDIDSDLVLRQGFAIVADIGEDVGKIKEEQKKQSKFNTEISGDVKANSKTIGYYNTAVKVIASAAFIWFLTAALSQLFG